MHHHRNRPGIKFNVEIHMTKVELKLAQQCRISVIFKRGQYKKETINAPVLEKGVAYFDEKISVPVLFYFNEKTKMFLEKEATLAVNLISNKAQRLIGITKFDLAPYLNKNLKETYVELKMDKCVDKTAKFFFKLNLAQASELDLCTNFKEGGEEEEEEEESLYQSQNDPNFAPSKIEYDENPENLSAVILTDYSDYGDGYSLSPNSKSIAFKKQTVPQDARRQTSPIINGDSETSMDTKMSSNRKDISPIKNAKDLPLPQHPSSSRETRKEQPPIPKDSKVDATPRWPNSLTRPEVSSKKFNGHQQQILESTENEFDIRSQEDLQELQEQSHEALPKPQPMSQREIQVIDSKPPARNEILVEQKKTQKQELPKKVNELRGSVEEMNREKSTLPQPAQLTPNRFDVFEHEEEEEGERVTSKPIAAIEETQKNTPFDFSVYESRILELETKIKEYEHKNHEHEQANKELNEQLQFSHKEYQILLQDYEELKQQYNTLYMEYQKKNPLPDKNEKRVEFELNIYKEKVLNLQQELDAIKSKHQQQQRQESVLPRKESLEEELEASQKSQSSEKQSQAKTEEYQKTINTLKYELESAKKRLIDKQNEQSQEVEKHIITTTELTMNINSLKNEVENQKDKIQGLESQKRELENENKTLKSQQMKLNTISDVETSTTESKLEKTFHEFSEDHYKKNIQDLFAQNQVLKKELDQIKQEKSSNNLKGFSNFNISSTESSPVQQNNETNEGLKRRVDILEDENVRLAKELKRFQLTYETLDGEKKKLMTTIKENQEKAKLKEVHISFLETELLTLKTKLAELVNITMEVGEPEILERMEDIVKTKSRNQGTSKSRTYR